MGFYLTIINEACIGGAPARDAAHGAKLDRQGHSPTLMKQAA